MRKSTKESRPVEHQLSSLFWMLGPAYARWVELVLGKCGTTPQRLRIIGLLSENGPMKMSDLRDQMGVTATNMTALIDALEKDKRVVRRPHPTDRRIVLIEVTADTKARFSGAILGYKNQISEIFSEFSPGERKQFLAHLKKLQNSLIERGILQEPST